MPKNALPSPAPPAALSGAALRRPAPAAGAGAAARVAASAATLLRRLAAAWHRAEAGSSAVAEAHRQTPEWHLLTHHRHMVR
ncbi:hypothetical protein BN1051_00547 [Arthrobacter saudimassiliensis]|uniref:Uncharacterized protein n=1 Tax=Arthrobacter saudimassiliensis TaxID=1461584 RepID=A0A078MLR3_9MICC|nr:hypothetical protein BN1051_00547 [Arthrobacter saudimassiliensis]